MLFGLVFYVIYRRYVEGTTLTRRVQVPEASLKKQPTEVEYSTILVPVFGSKLDDDIVSTAGRLADAEVGEGDRAPRLDIIYVAELPLTVPPDAPLPKAERERAERALDRCWNRPRGAREGRRGDHHGRRAAHEGPWRRDPGGHRWRPPRGDRGGDGVRAQEGAVSGPPDGTAGGRTRGEGDLGFAMNGGHKHRRPGGR
jgi:hypothetical protein